MYKRIVVGTDLSDTSKLAVERASSLASTLSSELILVYAGADPGEPLEEMASQFDATAQATPGNPVDVLLEETERQGADLLVVGSVGMSGARRFRLGNVPNKISHHATTDVLIVKTDTKDAHAAPYGSILVGTDGSETASRAVEASARLAHALGVGLTILCAYEPPSEEELNAAKKGDVLDTWAAGKGELGDVPDEFKWRILSTSQADDVLERAQDRAGKAGVQANTCAVEGPPVEALIQTAKEENFGLISVGSVGMSGARRFMLGNVPNRISHHAPCDVLILRTA